MGDFVHIFNDNTTEGEYSYRSNIVQVSLDVMDRVDGIHNQHIYIVDVSGEYDRTSLDFEEETFFFEVKQVDASNGAWKLSLFDIDQKNDGSIIFSDEPTECLGLTAYPKYNTAAECKKACADSTTDWVYQWTNQCMMGQSWDCTGSATVLEGGRKERFEPAGTLAVVDWSPDASYESTTLSLCDATRDVYYIMIESEETYATSGSFMVVIDQVYNCDWLDAISKLITFAVMMYIIVAVSALLLCAGVVACCCCGVACCCGTAAAAQKTMQMQQPVRVVQMV